MVNRIDAPPPPFSRKTEAVDTKQAIIRHEPDHHRRKKQDDDELEPTDIYEDLTDVSLPALRGFLQTLLAKIDAARTSAPQTTGQETPAAARTPASPQAAAAISAYQTRASGGHIPPAHLTASVPPSMPSPSATPQSQPQNALDTATLNLDRAQLLETIRDLDRLESIGISAITLEKSEDNSGFLTSIRLGIDRALGAL